MWICYMEFNQKHRSQLSLPELIITASLIEIQATYQTQMLQLEFFNNSHLDHAFVFSYWFWCTVFTRLKNFNQATKQL